MSKRLNINFKSKDNLKVEELNNILDKISLQSSLSEREFDFLDKFENISSDDFKDYNYLTILDLFYIMTKINKTIICDIKDKQGKINEQIISVDYNHDECVLVLGLKHGSYKLTDNFLYKLVFEFKHDNYSLDIQGEYHEKINLEK